MARTGASKQSIERMLADYEQSGLTRREYCRRQRVSEETLHYYQRRLRQLQSGEGTGRGAPAPVRLARVELSSQASPADGSRPAPGGSAFTVWLVNGRRVEVHRDWQETDLRRLIGVLEEAGSCSA